MAETLVIEKLVCKECKHPNSLKNMYCEQCGTALNQEDKVNISENTDNTPKNPIKSLIPDSATIYNQLLDLRKQIPVSSVDNTLHFSGELLEAIFNSPEATSSNKKKIENGGVFFYAKWRIVPSNPSSVNEENSEISDNTEIQEDSEEIQENSLTESGTDQDESEQETQDISENQESPEDDQETETSETTEETTQEKPEPEDKAHDDEFMESIIEKPAKKLNPDQVRLRRNELISRNNDLTEQLKTKRLVAELADHKGLSILAQGIKESIHNDIDNEAKKKDIDEGLKNLEAIKQTRNLLRTYKVSVSDIETEIDRNDKELDKLGSYQLNFLEDQPEINPTEQDSVDNICPDCANSDNCKEEKPVPVCPNFINNNLSEDEKQEIAETAEPCDPEDCQECTEPQCANNQESQLSLETLERAKQINACPNCGNDLKEGKCICGFDLDQELSAYNESDDTTDNEADLEESESEEESDDFGW